eukprot:CAMPEP_0115832828 /NCGR_PEP_ID=MMETSP0287-20121206/2859_1 /TAXON_ID=412157 /ORGANISM="Chrysochromulina rotalis, Strain UIO044" /LENGTH=182 /DNA_ID=CAMNT_0003286225 /DNA_START=375 /DNA_END=923 /DNA_ORIENTATION=-
MSVPDEHEDADAARAKTCETGGERTWLSLSAGEWQALEVWLQLPKICGRVAHLMPPQVSMQRAGTALELQVRRSLLALSRVLVSGECALLFTMARNMGVDGLSSTYNLADVHPDSTQSLQSPDQWHRICHSSTGTGRALVADSQPATGTAACSRTLASGSERIALMALHLPSRNCVALGAST